MDLGSDRCVPRAETGLDGGQGNFGQADQECETQETDRWSCGGSNLRCQGAKCLFQIPVGKVLDGGGADPQDFCMEDGDCPAGQYCPEQENTTHAFKCVDNYQTLKETKIEGMECTSDLQCGTNFVCRVMNPWDDMDTTKFCRKRWSRKLNEPCTDREFDCQRGLYCNLAFTDYGNGKGFCETPPPCNGYKEPWECRRYGGDTIGKDCFYPGFSYAVGPEHCTYRNSDLADADGFSSYISPMTSFYSCLGSKGCQIFQDDPNTFVSGLQRTVYSRCSRANCLSILKGAFSTYDPVMQETNYTCSKWASFDSFTGSVSAGLVVAPRGFLVISAVLMALLL